MRNLPGQKNCISNFELMLILTDLKMILTLQNLEYLIL